MRSSVACMIGPWSFGPWSLVLRGGCQRMPAKDKGPVTRDSTLVLLEYTLLIEVHRIDDADDGRIDRQLLGLGRQPGAGALHDEHELARAGADGINRHERAAGGLQPRRIGLVHTIGLDHQQLLASHRGHFLRGNDRSGDFRDEHGGWSVVSCPLPVVICPWRRYSVWTIAPPPGGRRRSLHSWARPTAAFGSPWREWPPRLSPCG